MTSRIPRLSEESEENLEHYITTEKIVQNGPRTLSRQNSLQSSSFNVKSSYFVEDVQDEIDTSRCVTASFWLLGMHEELPVSQS